MQLLQAVNAAASNGLSSGEANAANTIFNGINTAGDLSLLATGSDLSVGTAQLVLTPAVLASGQIWVTIDGLDPVLGPQQQAAIDAAVASLNTQLGQFGVNMIDVTAIPDEAAAADVDITLADTTVIGAVGDGVLGVTLFGGEITLVTGWNWYYGASPTQIGANQYDFQTVATHELGHSLGLGHSADSASVMYPYLSPGDVRRTLTAGDLSEIDADRNSAAEPLLASAPQTEAAMPAPFVAAQPHAAAATNPSVGDNVTPRSIGLLPAVQGTFLAQVHTMGQVESVNGAWLGISTFTVPAANSVPLSTISRLSPALSLNSLGIAPLASRSDFGTLPDWPGGELGLEGSDWDNLFGQFGDSLQATPFDEFLPIVTSPGHEGYDTEIWTAGTQSNFSEDSLGTAAALVAYEAVGMEDLSCDSFGVLDSDESGLTLGTLDSNSGEAGFPCEAAGGEGGE
jgi:hypothetical protein